MTLEKEYESQPRGVFNPEQSKEFRVKFCLGEIETIFSIKIRNFRLWKMSK